MLIRRETKTGANSFLTVYRPCTLDEFLGSSSVIKLVHNYLSKNTLPHVLLLTGDSGLGKTTLARIISLHLNCEELVDNNPCLKCASCRSILASNSIDVHEVNVGSNNGKDAVDGLVSDLAAAPFSSKNKVIIFDEAHKLSTAAQALLLKKLEDCYSHVYIIFCTNEPEKLSNKSNDDDPFLDRCKILHLSPLSSDEILEMLENVAQFEGVSYSLEVLRYICDLSMGTPRKALNFLDSVITEGTWSLDNIKPLLTGIILYDDDTETIDLCKLLIKRDFSNSCSLFEKLAKKYPVESIRIAVCGFFVGCLKRSSIKTGKNISNALTFLTVPIYLTGKPAEHIFYNVMFKVVSVLEN